MKIIIVHKFHMNGLIYRNSPHLIKLRPHHMISEIYTYVSYSVFIKLIVEIKLQSQESDIVFLREIM